MKKKEMHRPSAIGIVDCLCLPVLLSRQADLATHVEWIVLHTNIYPLVPFFLVVFFVCPAMMRTFLLLH